MKVKVNVFKNKRVLIKNAQESTKYLYFEQAEKAREVTF
jgi:hypothetical protein